VILLTVTAGAILLLAVWLARTQTRLSAISLGLVMGGAVGNAIDRLAYGWVADFLLLYVETARGRFDWYVFNLADAAIVAGVIGLVYDALVLDRPRGSQANPGGHPAKPP
jgi:signal peptidase II